MASSTSTEYQMAGQFTAENAAMVLIDYQVGTLQLVRASSSDVVLRNGVALAKAATVLGMPIVLTSSMETNAQGPIAPAIEHAAPDAFKNRIKREGIVNAWADPNFSNAVKALNRKNLIMAAITTDICLIFPCISALQSGYNVQAVIDASGTTYAIQDEMARTRMEKAGALLTTTNTVIAELVQNWASPAGGQLIKMLMGSAPMIEAVG